VPGKINVGDIDADGYPDIMITGKITRDGKDITQTAIFMNSGPSYSASSDSTSTVMTKSSNGITKDSRREFEESTGDYKI